MNIVLDDQPCPVDADTVREAIAAAAEVAEQDGRLIVEVLVDGEAWFDEDFTAPAASQPADEVRLSSAEPADLIRQTLDDASEALGEADRLQTQCAELFQADQRDDALTALGQALSIWQAVQDTIVKCAELNNQDPEQLVINDQPLTDAVRDLNGRLLQVREGLSGGDHVVVADTLLYDMPAVVSDWQNALAHLRDELCESLDRNGNTGNG